MGKGSYACKNAILLWSCRADAGRKLKKGWCMLFFFLTAEMLLGDTFDG